MQYILYCVYLGQCRELRTMRTFISIANFSSTTMLIKRNACSCDCLG